MGSGMLRSMRVLGLQHAVGSAVRSSIADVPVSSTDRYPPPACLPQCGVCAGGRA